MAAKLGSALEKIHWSLVLKSFILGAAWLHFPFYVFFVFLAFFYLAPPFQAARFLWIIISLILIGKFLPTSFLGAIFIGAVAYMLLGVKNLILVRRNLFFEIFLIMITGLGGLTYFSHNFFSPTIYSVFVAGMAALMAGGVVYQFLLVSIPGIDRQTAYILASVFSILTFENLWVLQILPLPAVFQAALFLLSESLLIELTFRYMAGDLTKKRLLIYFSFFFPLSMAVIAMAPWNI